MVFLGETDQIINDQGPSVTENHMPILAPEHLVDFAQDDSRIGERGTGFQWGKSETEAACLCELPRRKTLWAAGLCENGSVIAWSDVLATGVTRATPALVSLRS